MIKETEGGFDEIVDFAGNEKSMAFAVSVVARGGKIVVSGLMGGNFSLPMVQWVYKRMTIEGFMVGTLAEGKELMALARAGKIKPTPMQRRADGRCAEMDRRIARRPRRRPYRAEELGSEPRTVARDGPFSRKVMPACGAKIARRAGPRRRGLN